MITIDPQFAQYIIGAVVALIVAILGTCALLWRTWGELRAAKQRQQTAETDHQTKLASARSEIEAIKLSNEAAELRRQAEAAQMQADFNLKLQETNQKLQDDIHTLTVNFTAQVSELRGENNQLTRVQEALEKRLQLTSEQKIEAAQQIVEYQKRLDVAHASDQASTEALNKANELLQSYERERSSDKTTINDLQDRLNTATVRIGVLEAEVKRMKQTEEDRHQRANDISGQNIRMAVYSRQYKIALQTIVTAIPVQAMPPTVVSELGQHGIDIQKLLYLNFDEETPVTIPEPPPDKHDTPSVPAEVVT